MTTAPVQMLVVSFDEPNFSGEIIEELIRLRESNVVRLIDALAVQKGMDGELVAIQWSDLSLPDAEELGATVGALLGLGSPVRPGLKPAPSSEPTQAPMAISSTTTRCGMWLTRSSPGARLRSR